MLKYIQIDTFFEALQVGMISVLSLLGVLTVILILFLVMLRIPKILDPMKHVCRKGFMGSLMGDNPFIMSLAKGLFHILVGVIIIFYAFSVTGAIYGNVNIKKDTETVQTAYHRLEKIEHMQFTPTQTAGNKTLSHVLEYSSVVFVLIFSIGGIFFMIGSVSSFFQKVSYFFFGLCLLWYFVSLSGIAYVALSELVIAHPVAPVVHTSTK